MSPHHCPAYCAFCEAEQPFRRPSFRHGLHLTLSALTAGLWLISYAALLWHWRRTQGWRCTECGHRFRTDGQRDGRTGAPQPARSARPQPEIATVSE